MLADGTGTAVAHVMLSNFVVDLPTLCAMTFFVTAVAGLLLLFSWLQNRSAPALALWSLCYLLGAAGAALLALRDVVPAAWPMSGAGLVLCCAYGVLWGAARCFEERSVSPPLIAAGGVIWLVACQFEPFYTFGALRVVLLSLITATYTLLGAREVWYARDRELLSRWPTLALLVLHAGFLLARIPFAKELTFLGAADAPHRTAVSIMALEALFVAFCVAFLRVNMSKERAELEQRRAASTDWLTGVANRRAFFDRGTPLLRQMLADRRSAALILFDLDRFKEVNDTAGHQAGDAVLKTFAALIAEAIRPVDLFGRLGGEEFACLMPNASMADALQVAEEVRRAFAARSFPGVNGHVTVSAGIAMASDADRDLESLLATADRALYRAKAEGRNRVAPAPPILLEAGRDTVRRCLQLVHDVVA